MEVYGTKYQLPFALVIDKIEDDDLLFVEVTQIIIIIHFVPKFKRQIKIYIQLFICMLTEIMTGNLLWKMISKMFVHLA